MLNSTFDYADANGNNFVPKGPEIDLRTDEMS